MHDAEKVIKGLECCTKKPCRYKAAEKECPYWEMCDEYFEDCTTALAKDALALLKAQEPRVMTLGEIGNAQKMPLWKETKSAHKDLYTGWVLAYDIQKGEGVTGTRLGMSEPSGRVVWYRLNDYGKTWRCWTSRPDEKRRAEMPWN